VNAGLSLAILAFLTLTARRMARRPTDGAAWSTKVVVGAITAAALLDTVGLIVFAIGLESAPTWMVGLAASFGPAVTILVAVAFLGERLKPIQWFGLAGIAFGMIAIALP
jgi:drug/metabolite transporter (DMT)-like permease